MKRTWADTWAKLNWKSTPDEKLKKQVEILLAHGADVNAVGGYGRTALHKAAEYGRTEIVEELVNAGANINKEDDHRRTALHFAACNNHPETIQTLIETGADVNVSGEDTRTPLYEAVCNGSTDAVQKLIDANADVNAESRHKESYYGYGYVTRHTPLQTAAAAGHKEIVQALIKAGANTNTICYSGPEFPNEFHGETWTALSSAASYGYAGIVKILLEAGANPNTRLRRNGQKDLTALHFATEEGHREVIKILIESGADISAKAYQEDVDGNNREEWTPESLAKGEEMKEVFQNADKIRTSYLEKHPADKTTNKKKTKKGVLLKTLELASKAKILDAASADLRHKRESLVQQAKGAGISLPKEAIQKMRNDEDQLRAAKLAKLLKHKRAVLKTYQKKQPKKTGERQ